MNRLVKSSRRIALAAVLGLALTSSAGTALAATGPAPGTGLTGACNMLESWGVGANGGMAQAMSVDNPNGNDGMWLAVAVSGCPLRP